MARRHEDQILWFVIGAAAVPSVVALPLVWFGASGYDLKSKITLTLAIAVATAAFAAAARERVLRPLQTLGNLIAALRERDYAVRGRPARRDDALGQAMVELGELAEQLRAERWRDEEAAAGLARVVEGLDASVLAVDDAGVVRMANRAAERLGVAVGAAPPAELLASEDARTLELFGGTYEVRPSRVRLSGVAHRLIVMTDVGRALRAEERAAWQRLVRVLGHEINNSLGPIASIAETLRVAAAPADVDLVRGLEIIERRAAALGRFMQSYARLVKLPPPRAGGRVDVAAWVARTAALEARVKVDVRGGPEVELAADPDQLDQLLINLVKNAAEAALETGGGVAIRWTTTDTSVLITVEDDGPGVGDTANLFVPFFTTKPQGTGIGLVLARQIAENHRGTLVVHDRPAPAKGAEAIVMLPAGR